MAENHCKISLCDMVGCNRGDMVTTGLDGETIMLSIQKGKFYGLDAVGGRIWDLMQQPLRVSDVVELLLTEFDGNRIDIEKDTLAFLNDLYVEGMLTHESEANN
jgi:hypothetical protein